MNQILWFGIFLNALAFIFQMINLRKLHSRYKLPVDYVKGKFEIINKSDGFCDAHIHIDGEVSEGDYILMEVTKIDE